MPDLSSKMADSDLIPEGKIRFEDCQPKWHNSKLNLIFTIYTWTCSYLRERDYNGSTALLTRLLIFQRSNMADAHEDEETVIEEEYKVFSMQIKGDQSQERNYLGVEKEHSLPLRLGDHPRSGVAKVK